VYALEELGSLQALSDETGNSTNSTEGEGEEEEEERWSLFTKGFKWYCPSTINPCPSTQDPWPFTHSSLDPNVLNRQRERNKILGHEPCTLN
jgi:hypothetical protein